MATKPSSSQSTSNPKRRSKKSSTNAKDARLRNDEVGSVRASLLLAGQHLFALKGINGTSIRDIAQAAQVNSSMISYYFDGKEGLYRECLQEIAESRLKFAQQILKTPQSSEEFRILLRLFIENFVTFFLEHRETGLIIIREYDRIHSPAEKVFKENFLKMFDLMISFFKTGQKLKVIDKSSDPFILTSLFFGALSSQLRLDHIKDKTYGRTIKDSKERKLLIDHLLNIFC